jgi:hypothetical protein
MTEQSITEQGATLAVDNVRDRPRSWRIWIYAALFAAVTAAIVGSVALTNYVLNPLRFSGSAMSDVASVLLAGKNYLIYDGNLDWRAFRREYVRRMPAVPDIAVFGGSRWQEATPALVPGSNFVNVFVHSDYYEDMLAIAEVMYAADRLPKTMVLSIRYETFAPNDKRNSDMWKGFAPEARRMSDRLDLSMPSWFASYDTTRLFNLFSVDAAAAVIKRSLQLPTKPGPTDLKRHPTMEIIDKDGSIRFSQAHEDLDPPAVALKRSQATAAADRSRRLQQDPSMVEGLKRLIAFLKQHGVNVVLAQTPYHPGYFAALQGSLYLQDLQQLEELARNIAREMAVPVAGSLDAQVVGCGPEEFRDHHHSRESCLRKIFEQGILQNLPKR